MYGSCSFYPLHSTFFECFNCWLWTSNYLYVTAQIFINVKFEKEDTGVVIFDYEHIIPVTFLFSRPLGPKKRKKFYKIPFKGNPGNRKRVIWNLEVFTFTSRFICEDLFDAVLRRWKKGFKNFTKFQENCNWVLFRKAADRWPTKA